MLNNVGNNKLDHFHIAGLDGLRALAIISIVAYHFSFNWAKGGFLGVDIFFVLSGYLVTSNILKMYEKEQDFNFKRFWIGRIRRLLPLAYLMITTTVMWIILYNKELLSKLWGDVISSVFNTINWWFIFHKLSYFDSFGAPSPFKHLWFLAVQEQFYFIWPIVLITGLKFFKNRSNFYIIAFMTMICSATLMDVMYNPEIDPSRVYYGTDTRAFELLMGSLVAIVFPIQKFSSSKSTILKKAALNIISVITLAIFIVSAVLVDEYVVFMYRGGLLLFSLNTVILILCVCYSKSFVGNLFSWKPLRWIGTRSFGIYLWHYPIMVFSTPIYEIGNPTYWRVGLQLTITCILSELSYRFIEVPIRKHGLRGFYRKYLSFNLFEWRRLTLMKKFSAVISASLMVVLTIGIIGLAKDDGKAESVEAYTTEIAVGNTEQTVIDKDSKTSSNENTVVNSDENEKVDSQKSELLNIGDINAADFSESAPLNANEEKEIDTTQNNTSRPEESGASVPTEIKAYKQVLAIGDSIMLDINPYLKQKYTNVTIDGKVSRQMSEAIKVAPNYSSFNEEDKAVVIELGTNGYFTEQQIDDLLNYFSKAHIYLVNTRVPRSWESRVNKALIKEAEERENVTLIDWYSIAVEHPEYFVGDGVHLKPLGSEVLTNLISTALELK